MYEDRYSCLHTNKNIKQENDRAKFKNENEIKFLLWRSCWLPESLTGYWVCVSLTTFSLPEKHNHWVGILKTGVSERERAMKILSVIFELSLPSRIPFSKTTADTQWYFIQTHLDVFFHQIPFREPVFVVASEEVSALGGMLCKFNRCASNRTLPSSMRHPGCKVTFCVF